MEELYGWLWLCCASQLTYREKRRLLDYFKNPEAICRARGETIEKAGLNEKKVQIILRHQKEFDPQKMFHKWQNEGIQFTSCMHPDYPPKLRQICDYPLGLFFYGSLPQKGESCVAVVGARMCTRYGREMTESLARFLAERKVSVVSGLAYGIDVIAQQSCLKNGGKSYGILGCGPDICYPEENRQIYEALKVKGGLVSEYPPGTPVRPWQFPARNRLISGFCDKLVVVEAKKKSGSLITADFALEQGRDIYAFPGRTGDSTSEGCNWLISQGAGIILDPEEFAQEIRPLSHERKTKISDQILATREELVYSCVDSRLKSLQEIIDQAGLPVPETISILYGLKKKGYIEETGKNWRKF